MGDFERDFSRGLLDSSTWGAASSGSIGVGGTVLERTLMEVVTLIRIVIVGMEALLINRDHC